MKIVSIVEEQLYSFVYQKEGGSYHDNEYDRLMDLWTDVSYLRNFAKNNNIEDINQFVKDRLYDAEEVQDLLEELTTQQQPLEYYFQPLYDHETRVKILSLQKGKINKNKLRLYAIKIDDNCFIITGGAIKMSQAMQDHPDTTEELAKIKKAHSFLTENGVLDKDSFDDFKDELE